MLACNQSGIQVSPLLLDIISACGKRNPAMSDVFDFTVDQRSICCSKHGISNTIECHISPAYAMRSQRLAFSE